MKPDLFWIPGPWRGRLAVAGRPRGGDWLEDEVSGWHEAGLDIVVSLLEKDEADQLELSREGNIATSQGIHFVSFPIPDRGVPPSTPDALALISRVGTALDQGRAVAVHCRQGIGRSGLIAASLLVRSGIPAEEAIATVSTARGVAIPETPGQLEWIKRLPSKQFVFVS